MKGEINAEKLGIEVRMDKMIKEEAFIVVKDHKDNFPNNPKFQLLNPTKNNIGKIIEKIFGSTTWCTREKLGINTKEAIQ